MKIGVKKREFCNNFDSDEYIVDLDREFEGYQKGDLLCFVQPWHKMPLVLDIAIRTDGSIGFRSWSFSYDKGNTYLHTSESPENFKATPEQINTVNGLWSGRLKFEGLKLPVGATLQKICPIDVQAEEKMMNRKIYIT